MDRQILVWLVVGLLHQAVGYNLNLQQPHVIVHSPDFSTSDTQESLFGWSVENFKGTSMFVGAPRALVTKGRKSQEEGKVYKCSIQRNSNNQCVNIPSVKHARAQNGDRSDQKYGWYGASIAAGPDSIYTCAPFRGTVNWWTGSTGLKLSKSRVLGNCYKYVSSQDHFERCTEFRNSYPFKGNNFNQHWAQRGSYGFASVVAADDQIVVGAPLSTAFQDWSGTAGDSRYSFGQDYHSGSIVKFKKVNFGENKQIWPKVEESQFVILNTEAKHYSTEMLNHYKLAGMAIDKARMYEESTSSVQSAIYSYVIGAPKADNNLGKVYVCSKCFQDEIQARSNFYFPEGNFEVKPSSENRQIGEKFGASLAACDVNGDGHDDVIVGAPFYSDNKHESFNTGRVHVFVKAARGVNPGLPATLKPVLPRGARFGTAVACLGDTNGDSYQEVVVGAPYYGYQGSGEQTSGVIFIYQGYHLGLRKDYSQKITAAEVGSRPQLKGFGISFSKRGTVDCSTPGMLRVPDCSQCPSISCFGDCQKKCLGGAGNCFGDQFTCVPRSDKFDKITGLSVGAHMSNQAAYLQFRKVPRFKDVSTIKHENSIAPDTRKISVFVQPQISQHYGQADSLANLDMDLEAEVSVQMDVHHKRMSTPYPQPQHFTIRAGNTISEGKSFTFSVEKNKLEIKDGKPDPIPVDVTVKWRLAACRGGEICPMFDPNEAKAENGKMIEVRHNRQKIIVKSGCERDVCQCDMQLSLVKITGAIVAGEKPEEEVIKIILANEGREPAFGTKVNITLAGAEDALNVISAGDYHVRQVEGGAKKWKTVKFEVPFIKGRSSVTIPVKLRTVQDIKPETEEITLHVDAIPECPDKSIKSKFQTISISHKWNVLATPLYPNEVEVDIFNWDWRNEDKETEITQTFQIINKGPSPSGKTDFLVFIPKSNTLLSGHKVQLEQYKCIDISQQQVPGDIQIRSCGLSGECISKKCSVPSINKRERLNLKVSATFNLEAAQKQENPSFNVITSVQIVDHQNPKTTTFWKTTLEYRSQSLLQQIFNNTYIIAGVAVGVIVLIIICTILWKCNVFSSVRIYKDKVDEGRGKSVELK